jgi:hypothetical protein
MLREASQNSTIIRIGSATAHAAWTGTRAISLVPTLRVLTRASRESMLFLRRGTKRAETVSLKMGRPSPSAKKRSISLPNLLGL